MTDLSRLALTSLLTLAACDPSPPRDGEDSDDTDALTPTDDLDADGVTAADGDCNDRNDAIHPGARERSFDAIDSDCDGEDQPASSENLYEAALEALDADADGAISFEEFDAACARSAMIVGAARPGVAQVHASCGGTNSCRGMVLHPWLELVEHDCRGVHGCTGWSCVETAEGLGAAAEDLFDAATCSWCHAGADGAFKVEVPPGEDVGAWVDGFLDRDDARFRAVIAFGSRGVSPNDAAFSNMPAFYERLSRAEMDALIAILRDMPLEGATYTWPEVPAPEEHGG